MFKSVDQSQHTGPTDQSKHIAILGRMGLWRPELNGAILTD